MDRPAASAFTTALAIAAALILVNFSELQSFSLGSLKAEMRKETARAKTAADGVEATVAQLHHLATLLTKSILGSVNGAGRFVGPRDRERRYAERDRVLSGLTKLGVDEAGLKLAVEDFNLWTAIDFSLAIRMLVALPKTQDSSAVDEVVKCLDGLRSGVDLRCGTEAEHRACLVNRVEITTEINEWLLDLGHLHRTGELRRPQAYFERR